MAQPLSYCLLRQKQYQSLSRYEKRIEPLKEHVFQKQPPEVFYKKMVFLKISQNSKEYLCQSLFFNKVAGDCGMPWNFIKKETLTQMFSCEFWEIFQDIFFTGHFWRAASGFSTPTIDDLAATLTCSLEIDMNFAFSQLESNETSH